MAQARRAAYSTAQAVSADSIRRLELLAMARRSTRALSTIVLVGTLLVAAWFSSTFVQLPAETPRVPEMTVARLGTVGGYVAASWLAESQPVFADADNLPAWPFVLVFFTLFAGLLLIPNIFWK